MAGDPPSSHPYWDNVFIKVQDRLFCVPRCEFVQSSEVFADMFLLPPGPAGHTEGQDKEHPIVLEGYKKDDFSCLLKVMYPTAGSLISGSTLSLNLGKEEWVSVLKLSTIWDMEKIRTYAIHMLSTNCDLSPMEKIHLARAHHVATWLEEGITGLVNGDFKPTLDDLATLGWETAARILWIENDLHHYQSSKLANTLYFTKDAIKCGYCLTSRSLLAGDLACPRCGIAIPEDEELNAPGICAMSGPTDRVVQFRTILCSQPDCPKEGFSIISIECSACSVRIGPTDNVRITPNTRPKKLEKMIEETFGEEMKNYKIAKFTTSP